MMTQHYGYQWVLIPCLLVCLTACGDKAKETPADSSKAQTKSNQAAKVVTEKVKENSANVAVPPVKYVYVSENRRDPFQPFIQLKRNTDNEPDLAAQTPLQQYVTSQYKLTAVIVGYGESMAMVVAPNGKSYVVRKGMKIGKNGGTIMQINKESLLVEEKFRDLTDEVRTNILEIKLPKREGV